MQNVNQILRRDALVQLIQPDFFVGWTYSIDYEYAFVMTFTTGQILTDRQKGR